MKTTIKNHNVEFFNTGDKNWPVGLSIDEIFIGQYEDFNAAEATAQWLCARYERRDV